MGRINKRILITGANGFIGRNLKEKLAFKYKISIPSHRELDLTNLQDVASFFKKNTFDVVIHCAVVGGSRKEEHQPDSLSNNLKMFFNIIDNRKYYKRLILLGSGAEYDKSRPIIKVKESEFGKYIPQDEYGFFKYLCSKYLELINYDIIYLRLFGLFGKYEDYKLRFISNAICRNLFKLPITINKNVKFDYVYIDDLVKIIDYFIINKPKNKFYNVGRNQTIDLASIAKIINNISKCKSTIKIKHKGMNNEYSCSSTRLIKELDGFKFLSLEKSIEELFNWYNKEKNKLNVKDLTI